MAITIRVFGYLNPQSIAIPPPKSIQIGDLVIQEISTVPIELVTGIKWCNGPNEALGYVIARTYDYESTIDIMPNFWRSRELTEAAFIDLFRRTFKIYNLTKGADIKSWLNGHGYWTSWAEV